MVFCNVLPIPVHQSLHPCPLANQLVSLFAHHHLLLVIRVVFNPLWLPAFPGIGSKSLAVKALYSLKYRYIVQSYIGRTQSLVAKKKDISENRASRNFALMITRWRLLKITLQAPFLNVSNDVCSHQFKPRSSSNDV
ncbi:hypothetical protein Tco_0207378 [Tanacetum coccineum]